MPVLLVVRVGDRELGRFVLERGKAKVGSGSSNDLVVDHPTVSRTHLEIELAPGGVRVVDQGSTNGTRYQGARVEQVMVPIGAALLLGGAELRIEPAVQVATSELGKLRSAAPAMRGAIKALAKAAATDVTILLEGETGCGKEIAARAVHDGSPRAAGPFQVVDCGALARGIAQAELFGHAKGAFTGADRDRAGALESAKGGTIFLDELGELPLDLQPLLLRALEERKVRRVGETAYRAFDVRIVAATNRDLDVEVEEGRFRRDLLHRLSVVRVRLPALRERTEDLPLLARAILDDMGAAAAGVSLSEETIKALAGYRWPGNVRELRNLLERTVAMGGELAENALPPAPSLREGEKGGENVEYHEARKKALDAFERDFILGVMRRSDGNVTRAAKESGIDRVYLYRLMKKHGIE